MASIVENLRKLLEEHGEYVCRANGSTGWFAVFPPKWQEYTARAKVRGRKGPNLIIYKTNTADNRNHWVVPYPVISNLLTEDALSSQRANGIARWNLTMRRDRLHVSHSMVGVELAEYHGLSLLLEESSIEFPNSYFPDEIPDTSAYAEGNVKKILVNRYERDARARKECIAHYGHECFVCGFSFSAVFGEIAEDFIHVHHLKPLSEIRKGYEVNPIDDLRPLCPNCHAVVHRRTPPYSPEELRSLIQRSSQREGLDTMQ